MVNTLNQCKASLYSCPNYCVKSVNGSEVLALEQDKALYIPLNEDSLPGQVVITALKPILEHADIKKISYDCKSLYTLLKQQAIQLQGIAAIRCPFRGLYFK